MAHKASGPPGIQSDLGVTIGTGRKEEKKKTDSVSTLPQAVSPRCCGWTEALGVTASGSWRARHPSLSHWEADRPSPVDRRSKLRKCQGPHIVTGLMWTPRLTGLTKHGDIMYEKIIRWLVIKVTNY